MTLEAIQARAALAVAALDSGDYAAAIRYALGCKPLLASTPELSRGSAGNAQSIAFRDGAAIDAFIKECRLLQTQAAAQSAGPFSQSLIRYQRADEEEDYE